MIVIDASVVVKLINPQEEKSDVAKELLFLHLDKKEKITVPSLLYIEVANALVTKRLSSQEIEKGIKYLFDINLINHSLTEDNLIEAASKAEKYRVSVYDMLYAVIAKEQKTTLITADKKFVKAVSLPYVILLGE